MSKLIVPATFFTAVLGFSHVASANCRITNDTKWSFKVESGNTSNQSVGPHTTTSITPGKIKGKDDKAGKTISGSCKSGDTLIIKDEDGVPVLSHK
ncbi:MAG: hypothetical protein AB7P03_01845 [Kofleriaceae bacterium]